MKTKDWLKFRTFDRMTSTIITEKGDKVVVDGDRRCVKFLDDGVLIAFDNEEELIDILGEFIAAVIE